MIGGSAVGRQKREGSAVAILSKTYQYGVVQSMARGENKQAVSFRFQRSTVARLRHRAKSARSRQTDLVERYVEEGLRHDEHPLIYFREGAAGRRPALLGSRLDVADVITTIRQNDNSVEEAAKYLEVPVEQVEAALAYYADYKAEVDEWIERAKAVADDERERWRRRQGILA